MKRPALRWLMLWPLLLTVLVGSVAFAVYAERAVRQDLVSTLDDELARVQRAAVQRRAPIGGDTAPPAIDSFEEFGVIAPVEVEINPSGQARSLTNQAQPFSQSDIEEMAGKTGQLTIGQNPKYRVLLDDDPDGITIVTGFSLDDVDASISDLRQRFVIGGLVILALQALIIWYIANYVARPVAAMTAAANKIAGGALDTEIDVPGGSSETAELGNDLSVMMKRLRSTLSDSEHSAAQANQARDEMKRFMADASHELRTPLTALKGYSDLYAGKMLDGPGELDRAMGRIGSESDRMASLVTNMLQLARGESASERVVAAVDVRAVVTEVVDDLRAAYPDHQIVVDLGSEPELAVRGDRSQIHQAVLNLGANACQHTEVGTNVEIHAASAQGSLEVCVLDHGAGINPADIDKIFVPFYRADVSRSRSGHGGAGLGLALAKQIVENHGGEILVSSTPGGGATFKLVFPA